jgi:arsenate reductase-like glutaredoxin family protein
MEELEKTLKNTEKSFIKLLPQNEDDWRELLPLDLMVSLKDDREFEEFKENWEKFLDGLDKIWNRLNAYTKNHITDESKKQSLEGYLGEINYKRKNDDLLVYLDKARNSSHHTLWRHIRTSDQNEIVSDANGVHIDVVNNKINVTSPNGGTVSEIIVLNEYVVLLDAVMVVENKIKETYYLPAKHQNEVLYPIDRVFPLMIGKMGLLFYESVLNEYKVRLAT